MNQDHDPAGEESQPALALILRAEQTLHHELIGTMAGRREETAADKPRPERIRGRPRPSEIEYLKLARGYGGYVLPASGDLVEQKNRACDRTQDVHGHLDDIGPDDRCHSAFKCVEQGEGNDHENGGEAAGVQNDRDHD